MTTKKSYKSLTSALLGSVLMLSVVVFGGSIAHAQGTTYTNANGAVFNVPAGYQVYNSSGVYYDPGTGYYYDAMTGQYSTMTPTGIASMNSLGGYIVPAGYNASSFGTYYSPTTGEYYDPATGLYSTSAPVGPIYPESSIPTTSANPGLPNTGAGGDAAGTIAFLVFTATLAIGGTMYLGKNILTPVQ